MSTSGFVNTILRIRKFIISSVVTSTSKTISTNFSKYGHWILVVLGVIFNHIISPHRWSYTLSYKQKYTFIALLKWGSRIFFHSNLLVYHSAVIWVHLFVFLGFESPTPSPPHPLFSSRVTHPASIDVSHFWNKCIFFNKNIVVN